MAVAVVYGYSSEHARAHLSIGTTPFIGIPHSSKYTIDLQ